MDVLSSKGMLLVSDKAFGGGCGERVGNNKNLFKKKTHQTYSSSTVLRERVKDSPNFGLSI